MNQKRLFYIPAGIFLILVLSALPYHFDVTEQLVDRQMKNNEIRSFFFNADEKESRFQPREYIHINQYEMDEIDILEPE